MYQFFFHRYKKFRDSGNNSACQHIAKLLNYPASLIAKIVLTGYVAEMKETKSRSKAKEAEYLRKENSMFKTKNIEVSKTQVGSKNTRTIKKHDDPRVELALNLFDENDEIGKYFLDKFKFTRDRINRDHANRSRIDSTNSSQQIESPIIKEDGRLTPPEMDEPIDLSSSDTDTDSHDSSEEGTLL